MVTKKIIFHKIEVLEVFSKLVPETLKFQIKLMVFLGLPLLV